MIIAVIGPDGSGKSTYVNFLAEKFQEKKIAFVIQYPFKYFLLRRILDRLPKRKRCRKEDIKDKIGDIQKNKRTLFKFWPVISLLDNWIDYLFRLKNKDKVILCDRYFYDLAASFLEFGYTFDWLYDVYVRLIPKPDICFICNGDKETLQKREKGDTHSLSFFERQTKRYRNIAKKFTFFEIDVNKDLDFCKKEILTAMEIRNIL